jgi:hypothetical protein
VGEVVEMNSSASDAGSHVERILHRLTIVLSLFMHGSDARAGSCLAHCAACSGFAERLSGRNGGQLVTERVH